MKKPAIFLDRDNTLIISDGYLGDPAGVNLIPGAADAVAAARAMGFVVVVFSNQSGVARGLFPEEAVVAVNEKMNQLLRRENPGAIIDRHEYCPFHPQAKVDRYRLDSDLRKPRPGMIYRAADALDLDVLASWVIGDAARDVEAGHAAGCRTILVRDPSLAPSPAALERSSVDPDEVVTTLAEAMEIIEAAGGGVPPDVPSGETRPISINPQPAAGSKANKVNQIPAAQSIIRPTEADAPRQPSIDLAKLENLTQQILTELRNVKPMKQFSLSRMLAGMIQVLALAVAAVSCFYRPLSDPLLLLLLAMFLQLFTIALILMSAGSRD
ncbi:MAG: HAD-IIIA family hydrolase [Planctomycetota bacterium]|nr:HAD-IIIA family hydrolase [Planctomycetota bacterium]